tara:strand:- start:3053 stop:3739 length:687 start_codon:yes stop_codon:yes gene_type:complete
MNKLKTLFCAVFTLLLVNATAQADSSNFAGPYVGISGSGYGVQMDGESNSSSGGTTETDNVSVGQVAPVTGLEIGYALPIGSMMLLDLGGSFYSGEAKIDHYQDDKGPNDGDSANKDVSFKMDNLVHYYIAPTLVLSDTSSVYIKVGVSEADVTVSGDITSPGNLSGQTWAMGTRTVLESGIFIRTEAGYTDYNGISAHGKGTNVANTTTYSAEPTVAFGAVSLGFRF